jgi:TolA-binding protein
MERLWRRLADAQDAALLEEPPFRGVPAAAVRAAAAFPYGGRRAKRPAVAVAVAIAVAVGIAVVAGAVTAAMLLGPGRALRFQIAGTGERGAAGRALAAEAGSDLPLAFSDGSTVTFRAGSAGRVERLTGRGAEVELERGWLDAHVVHAAATVWLVHAGPFQVRVTGTRFSTGWVGGKLEVALYEGGVVVEGALLGTGVTLRAGQRLTIAGGVVRTEALGAAETETATATATATATEPPEDQLGAGLPSTGGRRAAPERQGWEGLCRHADARRLLMLGDGARYAGDEARARQAFEALAARFPRDRLAADALFSLGRLEFEAGRFDRAARWFERYVDGWPQGPLADQAAGRLLECAVRLDDREAATNAARAYLARAPRGAHAALARQALATPDPGGR